MRLFVFKTRLDDIVVIRGGRKKKKRRLQNGPRVAVVSRSYAVVLAYNTMNTYAPRLVLCPSESDARERKDLRRRQNDGQIMLLHYYILTPRERRVGARETTDARGSRESRVFSRPYAV